MIHYADGSEARIGDRVDLDGQPALVHDLLVDPDALRAWGLDSPGLLLLTSLHLQTRVPDGPWTEHLESEALVFQAANSPSWNAVRLISRAGS